MSDIASYLDSLLAAEAGLDYKEFKEFVRLMKEPSSLHSIRIRVPFGEGLSFLKDHVDYDILAAMKFRKVNVVDALWSIGETKVRLGDQIPEFIFRKDAFSTFHLDEVKGHSGLGLRFSLKPDTLSCGYARDVHFKQPEWIELEFKGIFFHASK